MSRVLLCLLPVLTLTLASCASLPKGPVVYAPPKVDCAIFDPPRAEIPAEPAPTEKALVIWQLYAFKLQEYAGDLLGQRFESAVCVKDLRDKGIVR